MNDASTKNILEDIRRKLEEANSSLQKAAQTGTLTAEQTGDIVSLSEDDTYETDEDYDNVMLTPDTPEKQEEEMKRNMSQIKKNLIETTQKDEILEEIESFFTALPTANINQEKTIQDVRSFFLSIKEKDIEASLKDEMLDAIIAKADEYQNKYLVEKPEEQNAEQAEEEELEDDLEEGLEITEDDTQNEEEGATEEEALEEEAIENEEEEEEAHYSNEELTESEESEELTHEEEEPLEEELADDEELEEEQYDEEEEDTVEDVNEEESTEEYEDLNEEEEEALEDDTQNEEEEEEEEYTYTEEPTIVKKEDLLEETIDNAKNSFVYKAEAENLQKIPNYSKQEVRIDEPVIDAISSKIANILESKLAKYSTMADSITPSPNYNLEDFIKKNIPSVISSWLNENEESILKIVEDVVEKKVEEALLKIKK